MLHGFASTVDWPTTYIWKELAAANPQGKIILTLRDPDAWYASAAATIFTRMLEIEIECVPAPTRSIPRAAAT